MPRVVPSTGPKPNIASYTEAARGLIPITPSLFRETSDRPSIGSAF
jgi:hypothetical protein